MTKMCASLILGVLAMLLTVPAAQAKVSPEEAARLGKELTPLGAIRAGNQDGTIPAWDGGITQPPPGYKPGMHHPNPFADDRPLFTITAQNVEQYTEKLSPGQMAMFKRYPKTWRMTVYPTRRSAAFPQEVYEATIANATTAELAPEGNGVVNAIGGIPFPIPKEGVEGIWNHILRYRGRSVVQVTGQVVPTAGGAYTLLLLKQKLMFPFYTTGETAKSIKNRLLNFAQTILGPARIAGRIILVHEPIDQVAEARHSWIYSPGSRRVRRTTTNSYDNPGLASDGQRTNDQQDLYNGSPDRYTWSLLGRREMYVPYNAYKLHSDRLAYDDIVKPGHINSDLLRYELHRVWVVEAKLKKGFRHIYARRTFYLDEDSWQILAIDQYDNRGEIWRVSEAYPINYYEVPLLFSTLDVHYDLQNGRYLALGLNNEHPIEKWNIKMRPRDFTPNALRRGGRR